jgi:LPXTG-site transpeptidase (sortase) family protein
MTIPGIGVDSSILSVGIEGGHYVAPAWDVGYQNDSVHPGLPGNSVYNGHLETINAGHVFARLREVKPGDAIYVYTHLYRTTWVVEQTGNVANEATWFLAPTEDTRLTLYTCEGQFLPLTRDFNQRRVVVARLVSSVLKSQIAAR